MIRRLPLLLWVFTGSEYGMTEAQWLRFGHEFADARPAEFRHGDCIGADCTAHMVVRSLSVIPITIHPSLGVGKRAWCSGTTVLEPRPPLVRNRDMVDVADALPGQARLIATPAGMRIAGRGGVVMTVNYALRLQVPVDVIWPDGEFERDFQAVA